MRKPKPDHIGYVNWEERLNIFQEKINKIKTHEFLNDVTNYEKYREFNDDFNDMTSYFLSIAPAFHDNKLSYEESLKYPHCTYLCMGKAYALYSYANHDIHQNLFHAFRFKDRESDEKVPCFDFMQYYNETILPFIEMFEHWINDEDDLIPDVMGVNKLDKLREGISKFAPVEVFNFPGTEIYKEVRYIRSEEKRQKLIEYYKAQINEANEKLKTSAFGDYYKSTMLRAKRYIKDLETINNPAQAEWYIVLLDK